MASLHKFQIPLPKSRTSLEAYQIQTFTAKKCSLEAYCTYFNSRFCLSQSRTSLEAYIDLQMTASGDSEVVVYDSKINCDTGSKVVVCRQNPENVGGPTLGSGP